MRCDLSPAFAWGAIFVHVMSECNNTYRLRLSHMKHLVWKFLLYSMQYMRLGSLMYKCHDFHPNIIDAGDGWWEYERQWDVFTACSKKHFISQKFTSCNSWRVEETGIVACKVYGPLRFLLILFIWLVANTISIRILQEQTVVCTIGMSASLPFLNFVSSLKLNSRKSGTSSRVFIEPASRFGSLKILAHKAESWCCCLHRFVDTAKLHVVKTWGIWGYIVTKFLNVLMACFVFSCCKRQRFACNQDVQDARLIVPVLHWR